MKEPTMISRARFGRYGKFMAGMGVLLFALVLVASHAQAAIINTGNPNLSVRFDNTVTYSVVSRIQSQNKTLLADPDADDAERNFDKGLVMNRFDLFSELELMYTTEAYNKYGVRVSGAGWYDFVYNTDNDNDSAATSNVVSVAHNEWNDDVKRWHGRNAELLDLYTIGSIALGDMNLRYRAGQFGQMWGKAFFPPMAANGIAGALAPVNAAKVATVPNAEFKEFIMPVPQASVSLQMTDNVDATAIYQFQWEPNRLFAAGSYYSPADFIGDLGAELGPAMSNRLDDVEAKDSGQWGLQVTYTSPIGVDFGFYALNVHARDFYMVTVIDLATPPGAPPTVIEDIPVDYYYLYPEDIEHYGVTADMNVGNYPLSVELTYRRNAPLAAEPAVLQLLGETIVDNDDDPIWPVGQTLHLDLTSFSGSNPGRVFCDMYDIIIEFGLDYLLTVDKNEDLLLEGTKDLASMMQIAYTPMWFQVFPGWDIYLPMGIAYSFEGRAAGTMGGTFGQHHGGSWNFGVQSWYNGVWKAGLTYTDYYGDTEYQAYNKRDTVAFYVTRTF